MADPTRRTPTLDEYGNRIKVNAVDIRTQAIPMQKEIRNITPTGDFAALSGHTCDVGVHVKNTSNAVSSIYVKHTGATAAGDGFELLTGEEVLIPTNQASKIQIKGNSVGTLGLSYKAY